MSTGSGNLPAVVADASTSLASADGRALTSTPVAPRVVPLLPQWAWMVPLVVGGLARGQHVVEADKAERAAAVAAVNAAALEVRRRDSTALAVAIDSSSRLSRPEALLLDSTAHRVSYVVPHAALHQRAATIRIDSTMKLLKAVARGAATVAMARALLQQNIPPLLPEQESRDIALRGDLDRLEAKLTTQQAQAAATAQRRAEAQARAERRRLQSAVPSGASARCRDGSYSFSANRSGTCSRHGGVAQWL